MRTCIVFLAIGLPLAAADPKGEPVKKELKQLQGTWKAVSVEDDGEKATEAVVAQMRLVFEGEKFTFFAGDVVFMQGTVKLDPEAKPRALDLVSTKGRLKGQTGEGIYQLDGDTLKICLASPGDARPTEFKSGKGRPLVVYKRAKR